MLVLFHGYLCMLILNCPAPITQLSIDHRNCFLLRIVAMNYMHPLP